LHTHTGLRDSLWVLPLFGGLLPLHHHLPSGGAVVRLLRAGDLCRRPGLHCGGGGRSGDVCRAPLGLLGLRRADGLRPARLGLRCGGVRVRGRPIPVSEVKERGVHEDAEGRAGVFREQYH